MIAKTVYILCAVTSLGCAILLIRAYLKSRLRLLLWSGAAFVGLALNNFLLVIDRLVVRDIDMYAVRLVTALASVAVLLYGLIWESD